MTLFWLFFDPKSVYVLPYVHGIERVSDYELSEV